MELVDLGALLGGRYHLVERRASGATATVWAAEDTFLQRKVAVKLLHEHLAADPDLSGRFADEAQTAATVNHPSLVAIYDTIDQPAGIVLEWIDGPDLRQRLDDGPVSVEEAIRIGEAISNALDALHSHGLVHRDVKPANVLLTSLGVPKLTDFGITTANAGDRTATGIVLGTAKYLAPEQVRGDRLDGRTDIYALASVLYEALTGTAPFVREGDLPTALARLEETPRPITERRPDLPSPLATAIMVGLAREPDSRWATAPEFGAALTAPVHDETVVISTVSPTLPPPPATPASFTTASEQSARPNRRRRRPRWPRLVGLAAMSCIALLGWTLINGHTADSGNSDGVEAAVSIVALATFDPDGTGPAGEHDDLLARAIDGDPTTGWPTERYDARDLGTKPGVGLVLILDDQRTVESVTVTTADSQGWAAQIRITNTTAAERQRATSPEDFGMVRGQGDKLPTTAEINASGRGNTVLVWFTDLGDGPTPIRLRVNDVTVS